MDVMGLQDERTYKEWRKLLEKMQVTDRMRAEVRRAKEKRRGKKTVQRWETLAKTAAEEEAAQREIYNREKGRALKEAGMKGGEAD